MTRQTEQLAKNLNDLYLPTPSRQTAAEPQNKKPPVRIGKGGLEEGEAPYGPTY